ncbi:MAG: hypothetical protein QM756_14795 [Polyangiaceae bacterium]
MKLRVVLEDSEHVVERGARETTWFVRVRDAWVAAARVEGAETERLEARPGTVWRQHIELQLEPGTRLMCVESAPRDQRKTPLEYLRQGPSTGRKLRRREFRLGEDGRLVLLEGAQPEAPKPPRR